MQAFVSPFVRVSDAATPGQLVSEADDRLVRLMLSRVTVLVAVGVVAGVGVSLWLSTFIASLLFGLAPRDPSTMTSGVALLAVIACFAGWLPAYRASRIDPAEVLREG